jgi:tRNA pseudouridine55 synthase
VVEAEHPTIPDETALHAGLATQVGEILQRPPDYSALRVNGKRAHELARAGHVLELEPRLVRIDRISLLNYDWPRLELEIDCGGGTYIRSIARDLGDSLGCGAVLERLVRSRVGHFTIEDAVDPSKITAASLPAHLRPPRDAVANLPTLTLNTEEQLHAVAQGRTLTARELSITEIPQGPVVLLAKDGRLLALATGDGDLGTVHPFKVLG